MNGYSKENYRYLLDQALNEGYEFMSFLKDRHAYDRCIYLRHDVDVSIEMAVELAQINASLGIRGTFFLLLRSLYYNLLSHRTLRRVREIHNLGQHLGFHYYLPPTIPTSEDEFAALVLGDFNIVKSHVPEIEPVFAWHNTRQDLLMRGLNFKVPGLVNVHNSYFIKEIPYYSDSNMRHSVDKFGEVIRQKDQKVLHLLFHPLNWIAGGHNMVEVWAGTWKYIIREQEQEMCLNPIYAEHFPSGMPADILELFTSSIIEAGFRSE